MGSQVKNLWWKLIVDIHENMFFYVTYLVCIAWLTELITLRGPC